MYILVYLISFYIALSLLFQLNDNNHKGNKFKNLKKSALINNKKRVKLTIEEVEIRVRLFNCLFSMRYT